MGKHAHCERCGSRVPVAEKPVFDGLKKAGVERSCAFCGGPVSDEGAGGQKASVHRPPNPFGDQPKKAKPTDPFGPGGLAPPPPPVNPFGDDTSTTAPKDVLGVGEKLDICRRCAHYVVHPYTQKCTLHDIEVTATDSCPDFRAT